MASHPYTDKEAGWEILAGQDILENRFKINRFMLVRNTKSDTNQAAILISPHPERTGWRTHQEGKTYEMVKLFDQLDGSPIA